MSSLTALGVAHFPKITYPRFKKVWAYFSHFDDVWQAEILDLVQAGWDEAIAGEFVTWRESISLDALLDRLENEGIHAVVLGEDLYPRLLAEINDPPFVLFVRGTLPENERPTVAVVGTRKHTHYGKQVTELLSRTLAEQGVVVVSGLALGIDGIAHEAALSVGGATVAVLGSGVDTFTIAPASHQKLAERILAEGGAVLSEYPPGFAATSFSFPARNRIIAGLSLGTLVTEAPTESGALITFKHALDYNRDVFAVPHPITSTTGAGGNGLIRLGAKIVLSARDILEELHLQDIKQIISNNQSLPANHTEAVLLPFLSKEPVHIDRLIKLSGMSSAEVNGALVLMEMKGKIRHVGGMMFTLRAS